MIQRKDMRIRKRVSQTLEDELYHLRTVNQRLIGIGDQLMQAQAEIETLRAANAQLKTDKKDLADIVAAMVARNAGLTQSNEKLRDEVKTLSDANEWIKSNFARKVQEYNELSADKDNLAAQNEKSARIIDAYLQDGRRQMATIEHLRAEITLMRQTVATWEMNKSIERAAAANVITAGNLVIEKTKNLIKENDRLRAALEASEKVCKIISDYMRSGEFFDPETSNAMHEWQVLKGGDE